MPEIYQHTLDNGLQLVAERVENAQSLAMTLLLPAGVACEPVGQQGVAQLLAEMMLRGAGELDARGHCDALDLLGVDRSTDVGQAMLRMDAAMIGRKLDDALPLLLDAVRRPRLLEEALEPSKLLALQAIETLEDEPQQKLGFLLREQHEPAPFGRPALGLADDIEKITCEQVRDYWQQRFAPRGSVLAFAGRFDWDHLRSLVEKLLGDWQGAAQLPEVSQPGPRGYHHTTAESSQMHIGLAYDALPEPDPRSILQRAAVATLSGGMSGRLFTEVREKRGLCYAVYARYAGLRERGSVYSYAGTTVPRAAETLEVLSNELVRVSEGVDQSEFDRAIVGMKSNIVMRGESTAARAGALATDVHLRGRPRSLQDWLSDINSLTLEKLNSFLAEHPAGRMTVVTIGPEPLPAGQALAEQNAASSA